MALQNFASRPSLVQIRFSKYNFIKLLYVDNFSHYVEKELKLLICQQLLDIMYTFIHITKILKQHFYFKDFQRNLFKSTNYNS